MTDRKIYRNLAAFLTLTGLFLAADLPAYSQPGEPARERPFLMAQGQGEVSVKPDVARLQIGVRSEASEVTEAVQANAAKMDAVLKAVRNAGVDEKDIITVNYSISPVYSQPSPTENPHQTGYQVVNSVRVTVRKIADAGKVLDAATRAGANISRGINFDLSEEQQSKVYTEALTRAVRDARQKVEALARASDAGRIELHSITEHGSGAVPLSEMAFAEARAADVQTPVVAGQMRVVANVTARYTFNPEQKSNY